MNLIKKRPNKDDDDKNIASSGQWIKDQIDMRKQNNWSQERHDFWLQIINNPYFK